MSTKLKRLFAKVALTALAFQLLVFGLATSPTQAKASIAPTPLLNSVTYAGVTSSPVIDQVNLNVSGSTTGFNSVEVNVTKPVHLKATYMLGTDLIPERDLATTGDNLIDLSSYGLTLENLQGWSFLMGGNISFTVVLTSLTDSTDVETYTVNVQARNTERPYFTDVNFASNSAVINDKTVDISLSNVGDNELANSKVNISVSRDCNLTVGNPVAYGPYHLTKGNNSVKIKDLLGLGSDVTYTELKSLADPSGLIRVNDLVLATPLVVGGSTLETYSTDYSGGFNIQLDNTAPIVQTSWKPAIVNNLDKVINVFFSANENMVVANSFTYKQDGVAYTPSKVATLDSNDFALMHILTLPSDFFNGVKNSIEISYSANDKAGNVTTSTVTIPVDTLAPAAVTGLSAAVNADGFVVLNWVNPPTGTYTGLEVKRDGVHLTTLPVGTTTFTDTNVVAGTKYSYTVTAFDAAGNETMTTPVSVEVPMQQIASGVSDSVLGTSNTEKGTVSSTKKDDNKKDEEKNEKGLPSWGIILLIILAAIGGYLIYSQKPANAVARPEVTPISTKSKNNSKTKTNNKK